MHSVQVPIESPDSPGIGRLVKLNGPEPDGNVLTGNAVTVTLLCDSVPLSTERNAWLPEMLSWTRDASLRVPTVRLVHTVPLSAVARLGVAEPVQCAAGQP